MKPLIELNLPHDPRQLELFRKYRDSTPDNAIIVEIGCYVGAISNQFVGGNRKVFCIDPWQAENVYREDDIQYGLIKDAEENRGGMGQIFATFMQNCGEDLFKNIFPIRAFSAQIAPYFNLPIDLLYIDGNHEYESVVEDIRLWAPKVKKGGLIAGDDYSPGFPGVIQAVKEAFPSHNVVMGNQWYVQI